MLANLQSVQRNRPWSMEEPRLWLTGQFKANPHPMQVGQALRSLGWISRLDWAHNGRSRQA